MRRPHNDTEDILEATPETRRKDTAKNPVASLIFKSLGITLIAFILSFSLSAPFTASIWSIFSSPEKGDFTLTDLYMQVADNRPVRHLDDRIVVVDIDRAGRREISELLSLLSLCGPKAVGLDVLFAERSDGDSALIEAMQSLPGLVAPLVLEENDRKFTVADKSFFTDSLPGINHASVNFANKGSKSTVREYAIDFPMADGSKVSSFPVMLASIYDPEAAARLRSHGKERGITSYPSRTYDIIPLESAEEYAEKFADKIVLIGALNEASDTHSTPIDSSMSGLLIHAHALSTILDGKWITETPPYTDYVTAFVICFLIVLATLGIKNRIRGLLIRIAQIGAVYLAVRIGYWLFIDHNIMCNFSNTLLMILFGLFAVDVWNGVAAITDIIRNKYRKLTINNISTCEKTF